MDAALSLQSIAQIYVPIAGMIVFAYALGRQSQKVEQNRATIAALQAEGNKIGGVLDRVTRTEERLIGVAEDLLRVKGEADQRTARLGERIEELFREISALTRGELSGARTIQR